jgi:hypothetical protein
MFFQDYLDFILLYNFYYHFDPNDILLLSSHLNIDIQSTNLSKDIY